MSILIQKTRDKLARFKELCPTWYAILFEGKKEIEFTTRFGIQPNIGASWRCVVGEAHGWHGHYMDHLVLHSGGCEKCCQFSRGFVTIYHRGSEKMEEYCKEFAEHFDTHGAK
jgi:hypothetical protein